MRAVSDATLTMLPPPVAHRRRSGPSTEERTAHVDSEHAVPFVEGDLVERLAINQQGGAVDEAVERSGAGEQVGDLGVVADVAHHVGAGQDVGGDDLGVARTQLVRQRRADASSAAGDDDALAAHRHAVASAATSPTIDRQRVVNPSVARQHVGAAGTEVERPTVEVLDATTRFRDQQGTGADVPRRGRVRFEKGVDATGGDVGEAQGRASRGSAPPGSARSARRCAARTP